MYNATFDIVSTALWGQHALDYHTNYIDQRANWSDSDIREEALYLKHMVHRLRHGTPQIQTMMHQGSYQGQPSGFIYDNDRRPGQPGLGEHGDFRGIPSPIRPLGNPMYPIPHTDVHAQLPFPYGSFPFPHPYGFDIPYHLPPAPEVPGSPYSSMWSPQCPLPPILTMPKNAFGPPAPQRSSRIIYGPAPAPYLFTDRSHNPDAGIIYGPTPAPYLFTDRSQNPDTEYDLGYPNTYPTGAQQFAGDQTHAGDEGQMIVGPYATQDIDEKQSSIYLTTSQASQPPAELSPSDTYSPILRSKESSPPKAQVGNHPEHSSDETDTTILTPSSDESMESWFEEQAGAFL